MTPPGIFSASFASASPTRRLSSSLSSTHGPAIRKSLSAGKSSATLFRRFYRGPLAAASGWRLCVDRRADEACEQRMRARGARLKLRVELTADIPRMRLKLHHLDQRSVGRKAAQVQSVLDELVAVLVVDLVAMAMPLADLRLAIDRGGLRSWSEPAGVRAEAHGTAHVSDVLLVFHQGNDRIVALRRKLTGVTVRQADDVAGEFNDCRLHSETDSKERQAGLARVPDCFQHSLDSPNAEASGNENAVKVREQLAGFLAAREQIAGQPGDFNSDVVCYPAVNEGFLNALVAVDEPGVLADDGNLHA